jgi:hypothetical protein
MYGGTLWCSSLRHCATNLKVAGSIPSDVIGIFHWRNPPSRTMALGLTQPLTEMSTRNISRGVASRTSVYKVYPHTMNGVSLLRKYRLFAQAGTF